MNSTVNIRACATVCDYLKKYEDPRLNDFYSPNTDGSGETTALKYGDRPNSVAVTTRMISVAKLGPTDPVYFMSAAEVAFLQAEAYAPKRGLHTFEILFGESHILQARNLR